MNRASDKGGYQQGRIDGFVKGKQDGYTKALEDAHAGIAIPTQPIVEIPLNEISLKWREMQCADEFAGYFGQPVLLNDQHMDCLKETSKSAIWKLEITVDKQTFPIILKIFKSPVMGHSLVELNMYRNAKDILSELMPVIYMAESMNGDDVWVFMEYVPQLKGQVIFTPDQFDQIIPALAKLHGLTYNERFYQQWDLFSDWLPLYHSESVTLERQKMNKQTLEYLDKAMGHPELKTNLESSYKRLQNILLKGPEWFPELILAGKSIIHNDLQTPNIGCGNVNEASWRIKFIDWEGARFAPCWFDMFNLVGIFFAYRKDWRSDEEAVIQRCAHLYAAEMDKYGIQFQVDPVKLYKMAYLQRILEKSLFLQLQWATEGHKQAFLLDGYLEKINVWGHELNI